MPFESTPISPELTIKSVVFSEGTYQVEVFDGKEKEVFWPFIQINESGEVNDFFCTCSYAEEHKKCAHLKAAYLFIMKDEEPIHAKFHASIWYHLTNIASRRQGYSPEELQKSSSESNMQYEACSSTGKSLFFMEAKTEEGKKQLHEMLHERVEETEETSLKFSNLSLEELALWKKGKPSHHLQYELSFWSDLGKWLLMMQIFGKEYQVDFIGEEMELPREVEIHFPDVFLRFYLAEANWPEIIPSLDTVVSSIPIYPQKEVVIEEINYNQERKSLEIRSTPTAIKIKDPKRKTIALEGWNFTPGFGFYPKKVDPLLQEKEIQGKNVEAFLNRFPDLLEKHLVNTSYHRGYYTPSYSLYFDEKYHFHICGYLFEKGDCEDSFCEQYGEWIYMPEKGFYKLDSLVFDSLHKIISRDKVGEFVTHHKNWVDQFSGFQTHLSNVEAHLKYRIDKRKKLLFETDANFLGEAADIVDLGEWFYIKSRGFYSKFSTRSNRVLSPGLKVLPEEISFFIDAHRDELEHMKNFFATTCPIRNAGIEVSIDRKGRIVVDPTYQFLENYQERNVELFGDYTYVEEEGFYPIPTQWKLPKKYQKKVVVPSEEETYFLGFEYKDLKPFLSSVDKRLQEPDRLRLKLREIDEEEGIIKVDLVYESEIGKVEILKLREFLSGARSHAITKAGYLNLKDTRYNWLRNIKNESFIEGKLHLTILEWIRLKVYEDIQPPKGPSEKAQKGRKILKHLENFQSSKMLDMQGLKSTLRPYQEVGVKWLWFLYSYGLSGLLCDEMGLGKTHQAMGLLSAVKNFEPDARFLVVCPTSVIFHWEDLLAKFLPNHRVLTFYGAGRTLVDFSKKYDVLLTSYGTLRSEEEAISQISFQAAIFDEMQYCKNASSLTSKAAKKVDTAVCIGLTGTPIENRLVELKALFDIVLPDYFPDTQAYREFFVNPIEKHNDRDRKFLLSKLIDPFLLRRKKEEVLKDLPEKIEEINHCVLSAEQKKLYKETYLRSKEKLFSDVEQKEIPVVHIFAMLNELKRVCNHPALIHNDIENFAQYESGKWDLFVELLSEIRESGQKVVIFSQYLGMLDIIERYLKEQGIIFAGIRGATRNRKAELDKFREDPQCEVFVASLKAVGVGVDLVSASALIHYDRWWNPAKENQATDRVHRIGQNRGVSVFKLVTKDTIEEHIHELIEKKKGLAEGVIGYDDQEMVKELNREELLELFKMIDKDLKI